MSNTNYIERLKKIIEEHHTQWGKFLRRDENKDLLDLILSYESVKLKNNNLQTHVYWLWYIHSGHAHVVPLQEHVWFSLP